MSSINMYWNDFNTTVPISSVSDPYSFDPDPDPAFKDEYRYRSGSRVLTFDDQKLEKNYGKKN